VLLLSPHYCLIPTDNNPARPLKLTNISALGCDSKYRYLVSNMYLPYFVQADSRAYTPTHALWVQQIPVAHKSLNRHLLVDVNKRMAIFYTDIRNETLCYQNLNPPARAITSSGSTSALTLRSFGTFSPYMSSRGVSGSALFG